MPKVTVDGTTYNLSETGPRNWTAREGNQWAVAVTTEATDAKVQAIIAAQTAEEALEAAESAVDDAPFKTLTSDVAEASAPTGAIIRALEGVLEVSEASGEFKGLEREDLRRVKNWGARGDYTTDDTNAIQACIDYQMFVGRGRVFFDAGFFKTTDTIHLGYGAAAFQSVHVSGEGYTTDNEFSGTCLQPTKTDRPCINFQGARGSSLAKLTVQGLHVNYFSYQNFCVYGVATPPKLDDTLHASWNPSAGADWTGSTSYAVGVRVKNGGNAYFCATAGTSAASGGPTGTSLDITDGTVHWRYACPVNTAEDSQYAPHAGVTIDAYAGTRPGTSYPDVAYAPGIKASFTSWSGTTAYALQHWVQNGSSVYICMKAGTSAGSGGPTGTNRRIVDGTVHWRYVRPAISTTQYGKTYSSAPQLRNVKFYGFNTGIAVQPCDADGNGDFVVLDHCDWYYNKYCISVGNTQSRNVRLNDCNGAYFHTWMVNTKHGRQGGRFGGLVSNCAVSSGIQFVEGNAGFDTMTCQNCYGEAMYKIGTIQQTGATVPSIIFDNCHFDLHLGLDGGKGVYRPVPTFLVDPAAVVSSSIVFRGGVIMNQPPFMAIGDAVLEDTMVRPRVLEDEDSTVYERYAHNAFAGGLYHVPSSLYGPRPHRIRFTPFNLATGAADNTTNTTDGFSMHTRNNCIPLCTRYVGRSLHCVPGQRRFGYQQEKSGLSSLTRSGRDVTIVFSSLTDATANMRGMMPGDVVMDSETNMFMTIRSRTTTTVIAVIQNNFKDTSGTITLTSAFSTTVGQLWFFNTRIYLPGSGFVQGDITSGSAVVANAGNAAGTNFTEIVADDWLFTDEYADLPFAFGTKVNSVATNEITLNANAAYTQARKPLAFWVRAAPANS